MISDTNEKVQLIEPYGWGLSLVLSFASIIIVFSVQISIYIAYILLFGEGLISFSEDYNSIINGDALSVASGISFIAGLTFLILISGKKSGGYSKYFNFNNFKPAYAFYFLFFYAVYLILLYIFKDIFVAEQELIEQIYRSTTLLPLLFLSVVVIGPVYEEILCRGFLYKGIEKDLGSFPAILISALFFAALHLLQYSLTYVLVIFAGGIILGYARKISKSIFLPIILHVFHNLLSLLYIGFST